MPDLILLHDSGTSHMGSLAFGVGTDVNAKARWEITEPDQAISSLRVHFQDGTDVADLTVRVDSHRGESFDMTLHTIKRRGTGADVNWRVPRDQLDHYYVCQGDCVVLTWTNPDDGTGKWGAELAMVARSSGVVRQEYNR